MADAIADSGLLGREDDMSFLEIDFDEAAGAAGSNDDSHAGIAQENEAPADDFDIQIDEFEVVENAGDYRDNGSIPSGDPTHADLSVPQGNTAESEIGYEDEEPLKAETTSQKSKAAPQEQGNDKIVGSTGNVDEIDYDDGDLEAIHEDHPATEPRPVLETLKQQEIATAPVPSQQVLDDTVEQAESAQHDMGAEDGSSDEPSEAGQGVFEKDERIFHTGGYPEDSLTGAPASEVSDVMVFYNGIKYELCASVHNDDPETYFFASNAEMDVPLSQFFGLLRDVIKDEIEPSDDLVIRVPQLKLEFGEDFSHDFLEKHTIRNILDLYRRFKYNDGQDAEHSQLVVHLVAKPNCQERFAMLSEAADAGRGWSEFFDNSDGSDSSSGHHSDEEPDGEQAESGSREDQTSFTGDDMQHEAVEIVEEAYFYDDTNDAGEHDAEHLFNDQDVEDPGHHADNIDDLNQGYELTDELVDNDEFDQVPGGVDNSMGYDHDGSTHQTYTDHDGNWPLSHADADTENMSTATGAFPGVTGEFTGGSEHESFNEEAGSALEQANTFANDSQDHLESTIQSDDGADVETTHASLAQNDFEDDDGDDDDDDDNFAPNDNSIDMEGLTAYDEAANNEPLAAELDTRATDSRDTSATSTVNGDEITYEDENLALANTENGTHEAGDDTADNVDEIDWENDGAEDVAVAADPTNMSSPSGLSTKRGREDDELISLDDENDAKRRKI